MDNRLRIPVLFSRLSNRLRPAARLLPVVLVCLIALASAIWLFPKLTPAVNAEQPKQDRQSSSDGVWQEIDRSSLAAGQTAREKLPESFRALKLNRDALARILSNAPLEYTQAAKDTFVSLSLPMPDGGFESFRIEESPVMEAELAAKFPEMKAYRGQGIDDPTATVRFDWTPKGFHAMVISTRGTVFIDPYAKSDIENYICYFKHSLLKDSGRPDENFHCEVIRSDFSGRESVAPSSLSVISDGKRRAYRLAVAATGEYTAFQGGAVALAMAAIMTSVNRVNGIFERELSIHLNLIANNNNIIYTNATTDPYTNDDGKKMLDENQANLDQNTGAVGGSTNPIGGSGAYDIGHVFSTGGGGIARLGSVCVGGNKARGVTGSSSPVGDAFDVDYVIHEMGHQFGADHTFNAEVSTKDSKGNYNNNCNPDTRVSDAAYEPGSGSTIMAYSGICSGQNLEPDGVSNASGDYFHVKSLEQIAAFINGSGNCAQTVDTGNNPPGVGAGLDYTIPQQTPFTLTATGSDPNGDALTFCWEEYDKGAASPPNTDDGGRPIFRSLLPTVSSARTFPKLKYILNNANTPPATTSANFLTAETLPSTNRTMTFQVTARDNRSGNGGINTDSMQVSVTTTSGPFRVTQPNTAVSWPVGASQTIAWDVANTTSAPVSCSNVRILLSPDGGNNFAILVASTPNDGSETITVPNSITTQARIKIEGIGNIFFDISDTNFTIEPSADLEVISKTDAPDPVLTGSVLTYTITIRNNGPTYANNVTISDNLPFGAIFNMCSATGGGLCGGSAQNRKVTYPTLAAGAAETITLTTVANCALADGALISNTATISSPAFDPNPANNSKTTTTTAMNPPPVITCPPDRDVIATTPGSANAIVTFPDPMVTDNCPGATVVCNPPSGSAFPLGTTTVNCVATDSGGATASCSFKVTVWDASIQDEGRRDFILFNSFTGDYKVVICGAGGFTMTGRGVVERAGCVTRLKDDTRVNAAIDRCLIAPRNTGSAAIKRFQPNTTFILNDRNILNNSPTCP